MPSPFPGMDPYLEMHWRDVHHALCTYSRDSLNGQIAGEGTFRASVDERVVVETPLDRTRDIYPDIRIVERVGTTGQGGAKDADESDPDDAGGVAVAVKAPPKVKAKPLTLRLTTQPQRQGFIEIRRIADNRLITVVEFISPTNKLSVDGRRQYRQKQRDCIGARVSLVEIDLTRGGKRRTIYPQTQLPADRRTSYVVSVYRGWQENDVDVFPISLHEALPTIPVPLTAEHEARDAEPTLDLQALVAQAYDNGAYGPAVNYDAPCIPPLKHEEGAWADRLLRDTGRRTGGAPA